MKPDSKLVAGQELMLNFQVFDANANKPATDLQNYLGELAHFVLISEDMRDFVHAHPMSKGEHANGRANGKINGQTGGMQMSDKNVHNHASDNHSQASMEGATTKPSESEVAAHTSFPRAGLYKVWAQFQRNNRVITVPFVVRVGENGKAVATNKTAAVPAGAIKVTVSKNGYEPATIDAEKGQPLKLAFYRVDTENCGGEVVFSNENIRKKLSVGEIVTVEFTPKESGEIGFACGMNMYKGKVIVN